jgi:hypothetical protein
LSLRTYTVRLNSRARLPAEEGAVVLQALNAAMDARYAEHNAAEPDDVTAVTSEIPDRLANRFAQRRADALTIMAETTLRHGPELLSTAERYQVVMHVTAETLAGNETGRCELDDGQRLALDTVRRIACNGSLLRITEDDAGNPLDIGRKTRAIPSPIRRCASHPALGGWRRHLDRQSRFALPSSSPTGA